MVKNARKGMLFAGGVLLGVLAGAVGMMSLRGGDGPYASSPPATRTMGAPPSTAFVTAVAGNCELAPMLPNAGDGDGKETLQAKPGGASASEVGSLILSGKEAAASGRQRDAEIDFLNACRNAAALQDGDPIPLADSMYQLGRHYATVAALGASKSPELFRRAERLYSASLEAYRARYGDTGEKTRFAKEGLTTVQQATGGKTPALIAKAPPPPAAPPVAAAPAAAAAPEATASAAVAATPGPAPTPAVVAAAPAVPRAPARVVPAPARAAAAAAPEVATAPVEQERPASAQEPRAPVREARVRPEPRVRSEPVPTRNADASAREDDDEAAGIEPPRPRPQAHRAPRRDKDREPAEVAAEVRRPARLPPPIFVGPAEPRHIPDTSRSGYGGGGGVAQAEGSPNAP